jgi:hypothetical protein
MCVEVSHRRSPVIKSHAIAAIAFGLIESVIGGAKQVLADNLRMARSV